MKNACSDNPCVCVYMVYEDTNKNNEGLHAFND